MRRNYNTHPGTLTEILAHVERDNDRLVALTPDYTGNTYWGISVSDKGIWEYKWFLTEPRLIINEMKEQFKEFWQLVALAPHIRSNREDYEEWFDSPEEDAKWTLCRAVVERRVKGEGIIMAKAKAKQAVENVEVSA